MATTNIPIVSMTDNSTFQVPGDYGAVFKSGTLYVPPIVHGVLKENNWMGPVLGFISVADTFPSAFAQRLGWNVDDVKKANRALIEQLKREIPGSEWPDLDEPRPQRAMGAMPPPGKRFEDFEA